MNEKSGDVIYLKSLDEETAFFLTCFVKEKLSGITLAEVEGVVLRYQVQQPLDSILRYQGVTLARRYLQCGSLPPKVHA